MDANRKIKFHASRRPVWIVLTAWVIATLACSQGYVSSVELTATASALPTRPDTATPPPTPAETRTPVPIQAIGSSEQSLVTPGMGVTPSLGVMSLDQPSPTPTRIRPTKTATKTVTPGPSPTPRPPIQYYAQAGDTLPVLSVRFGVEPQEIISPDPISPNDYIRPNQLLLIPDVLDPDKTAPQKIIMPDSEVVYSPSAINFDITTFVNEAGGKLSTYREWMSTGWFTGADVVRRVAVENSINPRLLLALIEYQSHWVYGEPQTLAEDQYPVGDLDANKQGLYKQLSWAVEQLSIGYYGWQSGLVTTLEFEDGSEVRLWPSANAGTIGVAYFFSRMYTSHEWANIMNSEDQGFLAVYQKMFGNPFTRADTLGLLFPPDLAQPELNLPYRSGESWAFTGGPHPAWGPNGALAAVDFAPPSVTSGCTESNEWATAMATGKIVRVGNGVVVLDTDGDGSEQTGWVILYMHIATRDRVALDTIVTVDDRIGHPSCEGGVSTGTHVHIARKYNGQWILADSPLPMVLSGWRVHAGKEPYQGSFTKDDKVVTACTCGSAESRVLRP